MADQPKWTPGPWGKHQSHIYARDGAIIAQVHNPGAKAADYPLEANRDLMVAAPDLYAALEPLDAVATDRAVDAPEWRDKDTVGVSLTIGELRAIRAALAKARGDSAPPTPSAESAARGETP